MRAHPYIPVLAAVAAAAAGGCSTSSSEAGPARADVSDLSNEDFVSTTNFDVSFGDHRLWAVVVGVRKNRRYGIEVYRHAEDGSWHREPQIPDSRVGSQRVAISAPGGRPCVSGGDGPLRLLCLRRGRWASTPRLEGAALVDMETVGGVLTTLAATRRHLRVLRLVRNRWIAVGPPIRTRHRIAQLGEDLEGRRPLVSLLVTHRGVPARVAFALDEAGRWRRLTMARGGTSGPMVSGPVRTDDSTLLAYTEATSNAWPFRVAVRRRAGRTVRTLSSGHGAAQGVLGAASGAVWAIWQENRLLPGRGFDTVVRLRRLQPAGPPRTLWTGVTNGPGDLEVFDGPDGTWAGYMPARSYLDVRREVRLIRLDREASE